MTDSERITELERKVALQTEMIDKMREQLMGLKVFVDAVNFAVSGTPMPENAKDWCERNGVILP